MDDNDMYFEKDGHTFVRVNIVDDNDPNESQTVDIPQEYYEKIQSGDMTINKCLGPDGKSSFMIVDNNTDEVTDTLNSIPKTSTDNIIEESPLPSNVEKESTVKKGETYFINQILEYSDRFQVILSNENNETIDVKIGRVGETVNLNLLGTIVSYEITGENDNGVYPQTTLCVDADTDDKEEEEVSIPPHNTNVAQIEQMPPKVSGLNQEEYIIEEKTVQINGYPQQLVTITDKAGHSYDKKTGVKEDIVKLQVTDKAFEYSIQGPFETGEPIYTSFIINNDDVGMDEADGVPETNIDPAESWCPQELSKEEYAAIREQARLVAKSLENSGDLPSIQPYSEQLGSKSAYEDIRELVERYKSIAEERRADLNSLRKHSKLYIPMKVNARRLTHVEWATNEAAAQICRYQPALLFHKRKLFEYAAMIIDNTGLFPNESLRQTDSRDENDSTEAARFSANNALNNIEDTNLSNNNNISRNYPPISIMNDNNFMNNEMNSSNNLYSNNYQNFNKRNDLQFDFQLTTSEEMSIKNAAERLQEELYQYPIKPATECKQIESHIRDEIPRLKVMLEGSQTDIEQAHEYMRENSAVNGRMLPSQRARAQPISPYDVAVNEAAYHLVKNNLGLLTYRKVLADLAKKVIRASGCSFRHTTMGDKNFRDYNTTNLWLYNQENIPELDLSPAVKVLSDPLEEGPLQSIIGSSFVPVIEEKLVVETDDDEEEIYRPSEFELEALLGNKLTQCQPDNNILNENAIFCHTGTDDLKKVRILDFRNLSFTSILPMDMNFCYNLVELNLSNNYISYLPRCLFLPNLTKLNLRKNRFITVPLLEQFPKIYSVEIDERIARKLNVQSLTFFCQELCYINNKKFKHYISEEFNTILLDAKTSIESMVQSRWEEDLAMYFKKGVTKSESQKVIETLVLSVRERKLYNENLFFAFKDLIARKVAESFLDSKIIDDEEEEELRERLNNEEVEDDDEDDEERETFRAPLSRNRKKNEFDNQLVEKGQILLQDEPLDRLTNVVGQALRSGKTVVYSVMRTAARQPGGDLIPVGGCDSSQNNNISNNYLTTSKKTNEVSSATVLSEEREKLSEKNQDKSVVGTSNITGSSATPKTKPGPASFKKRVYGVVPSETEENDEDECTNDTVENIITSLNCMTDEYFDRRKVGRPKKSTNLFTGNINSNSNKENLERQKQNMFKLPRTLTGPNDVSYTSDEHDTTSDLNKSQQHKLTGKDIMNQETYKKIGEIVRQCTSPIPPSKLRELLGITSRGRHPRFIKDASDRTYIKHRQPIPESSIKRSNTFDDMMDLPPAHAPLPERPISVNKQFNTRDSNRLKRFDVYDTDNPGWMELEDESIDLMNNSVSVKAQMQTGSISNLPMGIKRPLGTDDDYEYQPTPKASRSETASSPTKSDLNGSEASFVDDLMMQRKIKYQQQQHQRNIDRGQSVNLPYSSIFRPPDITNIHGLGAIAAATNSNIADYDPLHFIRCHARDNDPNDSLTKVWRCAFEPLSVDPYSQTTHVVATCGGECVCLIDCRTGKVMKRFKSRDEEFYTVAWTTLEFTEGLHINILAAAGKSRHIRLLHPEQLVCYCEIRATTAYHHQHEIACLVFHPRRPTVMFSGDAMATVIVWDIGIPTAPNYTSNYQLLATLVCPRAHLNPVLNLIVMPSYDALIAGCEDGVFVWNFPEFKKYKPDEVRPPDFEVKVPTHQEPCFDGLARLSENMFLVKCVEEGEIFSINFAQLLQHYRARKFDEQNRVVADIMVRLRWQITDEIYINVSAQNRLGAVACGDNEGTIWLYDMSKQLSESEEIHGVGSNSVGGINLGETSAIVKKANIKSVKLLDWPECSVENNNSSVAAQSSNEPRVSEEVSQIPTENNDNTDKSEETSTEPIGDTNFAQTTEQPIKVGETGENPLETHSGVTGEITAVPVQSNPVQTIVPATNANKNPVINCVEMSSDAQFIVAVTDNNLVCIWSIPL